MITLVGRGTVTGNVGQLQCLMPAGIASGDFALIHVTFNGDDTLIVTGPAGFTEIMPLRRLYVPSTSAWIPQQKVFYKFLDGTETEADLAFSTGFQDRSADITVWRGVDPVTPMPVTPQRTDYSTNEATYLVPSITPDGVGYLYMALLSASLFSGFAVALVTPSWAGWGGGQLTEEYDNGTHAGVSVAMAAAVGPLTGIPTGTPKFILNGAAATAPGIASALLLKPIAPPPIVTATRTISAGAHTLVTHSASVAYGTPGYTWTWRQISGTAVTLSSTTAQNPTFTAPSLLNGDTLVFGVTAHDSLGAVSAEVQVTVTVAPQATIKGKATGQWFLYPLKVRTSGAWH